MAFGLLTEAGPLSRRHGEVRANSLGVLPLLEHWNHTVRGRCRFGHECMFSSAVLSELQPDRRTQIPSSPEDRTARQGAPGHPLLEPLSAACLLISFISYNTTSVGSLGMLLCLGTGTIGGWGFWAVSSFSLSQ